MKAELEKCVSDTQTKSQKSSSVPSPKTWPQRLVEAEKRPEGFTNMDVESATSWGNCVMSTRQEFLYRSVEEEELTMEAHSKGMSFGQAVEDGNIKLAKKYCEEILNMKVVLRPEEHSEFLEESRKYPIV